MGDTVSLLTSGAHANVATVYSGTTPQLTGWAYGSVPLAAQVKGEAVDVSDYALLRFALDVTALDNARGGEVLYVSIEHSPDGVSEWELLHSFDAMRGPGTQRKVLGTLPFVRASYYFARPGAVADGIRDGIAFTFSLTADAVPAAA